jgi:hypothetical protein
MSKLTGRDLQDFSLTMRELAPLPWRQKATDAQGRATKFRANGIVAGLECTIVQDIDYYTFAENATRDGLVEKLTYTIVGPDVAMGTTNPSTKTIEIIPLYDANTNLTGQDVKINGVSLTYTEPAATLDIEYTSATDFTATWANVTDPGTAPDGIHTVPHYMVDVLYQADGTTLIGYAGLAPYAESGSANQSTNAPVHKLRVQWKNLAGDSFAYGTTDLAVWISP